MVRTARFAVSFSASLIAAIAIGATAQAAPKASKCVMAGGEANMVTQGLAEFMANAALKNSIKGMGAEAAGPIALKCNANGVLQYCKATRRACK